jgi:5-methylcytosine-specific restriction endonuclease McrA
MTGPRSGYSAGDSRKWRARLKATLPAPCSRCGIDVMPTDPWDVDHLTSMAEGGTTIGSNLAPAHRGCNRSAGGKLARSRDAAKRNHSSNFPNW